MPSATEPARTMENEHRPLFTVHDGLIAEARLYADTAKGRESIDGLRVYPSRPARFIGQAPAGEKFTGTRYAR